MCSHFLQQCLDLVFLLGRKFEIELIESPVKLGGFDLIHLKLKVPYINSNV